MASNSNSIQSTSTPPTPTQPTPTPEMKGWLMGIKGIGESIAETYATALAGAGYTEVSDLESITRDTLAYINMTNQLHVDRIMQAAKALPTVPANPNAAASNPNQNILGSAVEVDFKDLTNLKITPTGDKKTFPGFFVGFQHVSEQIQKLVDYMKGEQKIAPHSSVTVVAGVNKCGKTTLLTTIIPAFIHHNQLQPIIIYTSCENFDCSTLSATCAGLYDLLFAKLRIYSPTATNRDPSTVWEASFISLAEQFSAVGPHVVIMLDEYQGLFAQSSHNDVLNLARIMKKFMVNPQISNLHFILSSSNSPVLWSCLSLAHPNGRDILADMRVIPMGICSQGDLDTTKVQLAEALNIRLELINYIVAGAWNPSPGMFAFLVETYLQGVDGAHPYERIENAVVTVHNQITDRIKADYTHLFLLAQDQHDPRSNLWNALYSLFSCHGVPEEHFALAMRCHDRLPMLQKRGGSWKLYDEYLAAYVLAHADAQSHFTFTPSLGISAVWEQGVARFMSLFGALHLYKIDPILFEISMARIFGVDNMDKVRQVDLGGEVQQTNEYKLAYWLHHMIIFGDKKNERQVTVYNAWIEGRNLSYCPMWELCVAFRNFCAHAIDEPAMGIQQKRNNMITANFLWGEQYARQILWNQVDLFYSCITHCERK